MSETLWKGDWWLPGDPDETRPGTLYYGNDDDRLRLELIGGFSIEVRTPSKWRVWDWLRWEVPGYSWE